MSSERNQRPDPAPGAAGPVRDVLSDSAREGSVLESSRVHGIGSGRQPSATDMPVGSPLALPVIPGSKRHRLDAHTNKPLDAAAASPPGLPVIPGSKRHRLDPLFDRQRARLDALDFHQMSVLPSGAAPSPAPALSVLPPAAASPPAPPSAPAHGAATPMRATGPAPPSAASPPDKTSSAAAPPELAADARRALLFAGALKPFSAQGMMEAMQASRDEEGDAVDPPPLPPERDSRAIRRIADPGAPKPAPIRVDGDDSDVDEADSFRPPRYRPPALPPEDALTLPPTAALAPPALPPEDALTLPPTAAPAPPALPPEPAIHPNYNLHIIGKLHL